MKIPDFKKIFSHKAKQPNKSFVVMSPNHDWKIIIYTFVFLLVVFFAFSFYFLDLIKKDGLFNVQKAEEGKAPTVNQALLDQTIDAFNAKSKKINSFPKSDFFLTDPSK